MFQFTHFSSGRLTVALAATLSVFAHGVGNAGCLNPAINAPKICYWCDWGSGNATLTFCGCKINIDCESEMTCAWTYDKTFSAAQGKCELVTGVLSFNCGTVCVVGQPCTPDTATKVVLKSVPCPGPPCPNCVDA